MDYEEILERLEDMTENAPDAFHEAWNLYASMCPQEAGVIYFAESDPDWGLPERVAPLGPDWMAAAVANSPKLDPKKIFVMARCYGGDCTMENCAHCELTSANTPDELADAEALAKFIAAHEEPFFERWPYLSPDYVSDDDD
ncbi:MAG: hypothetical protein J6Z30_04265 [Pyramidobacter sp.]|nr:hypothetical protein [Pyramidobacter sp.]